MGDGSLSKRCPTKYQRVDKWRLIALIRPNLFFLVFIDCLLIFSGESASMIASRNQHKNDFDDFSPMAEEAIACDRRNVEADESAEKEFYEQMVVSFVFIFKRKFF